MKKYNIQKVVVAGGGLMSAGISQMFPEYGFETVLYSVGEADFIKAKEVIDKSQQALIENGKLTEEMSEKIKAAIYFTTDKNCFQNADLVIEAIPEHIDLKKSFYKEICALVREDTILASNAGRFDSGRFRP